MTSLPSELSCKSSTPARAAKNAPIIEIEGVLIRLNGDTELLRMLAEIFPEDSVALMAALREGASANDAPRAERAVHSLKSLAANFNASHAVEVAAEIERLARHNDLPTALPLIPVLECRLAEVGDALAVMWTKPPLATQ